jgi:hypothetical protein
MILIYNKVCNASPVKIYETPESARNPTPLYVMIAGMLGLAENPENPEKARPVGYIYAKVLSTLTVLLLRLRTTNLRA